MYFTIDDITENRIDDDTLIDLTDKEGLGEINTTRVNNLIAEVDDMINGACSGRYQTPVSPVPSQLLSIALDLVTYKIYGLRPQIEPPKTVVDNYATARKDLTRISEGNLKLIGAVAISGETVTTASDLPAVKAPTPVFTDSKMAGWMEEY
ncbi:DUF1320 domain-containing protein [uncultured Desulfuromonas sp.]|uniref:DUF1320 domain-containing protein n=1 Tax=uncultured Desulfuromonas sp. TaxID=181013 RepID=UPI002AAA95F2|nr:DUF1320 domain-containing protein [uncultured Desulfuromonas sp.]